MILNGILIYEICVYDSIKTTHKLVLVLVKNVLRWEQNFSTFDQKKEENLKFGWLFETMYDHHLSIENSELNPPHPQIAILFIPIVFFSTLSL